MLQSSFGRVAVLGLSALMVPALVLAGQPDPDRYIVGPGDVFQLNLMADHVMRNFHIQILRLPIFD